MFSVLVVSAPVACVHCSLSYEVNNAVHCRSVTEVCNGNCRETTCSAMPRVDVDVVQGSVGERESPLVGHRSTASNIARLRRFCCATLLTWLLR